MKTKSTTFILFLFIVFSVQAQPEKGTWQIGGSGYRTKIYNHKELNDKIMQINAETSYFLFKYLALGGRIVYQRDKNYTQAFDPVYRNLFVGPILDAYILNRKQYSISVKGTINFAIQRSLPPSGEVVSSYMFGPKIAWNITPNLSTFLWAAYRRLDGFDNTSGFTSVIPSDNFDIRWGFSYFLHRKKK